jgi:hypothetical protein
MKALTAFLGGLLALGLSGCAASAPQAKGDSSACCAKDPAKPMTCDKKEHSGGCCSKGGAKTAAEGHQH